MANEFVARKGIISLGGVTFPVTGINANYTVGVNDYLVDGIRGDADPSKIPALKPLYNKFQECIDEYSNRIVVDYNGLEELVVLGVIETATDEECNYDEMANEGFVLVKKYDGIKDYSTLKSMIANDAEGYVIRFSNGDRMKIKGEEYLRLHKIMTNVSTTAVWEILSSGGDIDAILKDVPDEFYKKIKSYVSTLNYGYYQYWNQLGKTYDYFRFGKYGDKEVEPTKKALL